MSRAFVKELDGNAADADLPERVLSQHPLYLSARGMRRMQETVRDLRARRAKLVAKGEDLGAQSELRQLDRDLKYYEAYLQQAIEVSPPPLQDDVRFGAEVELLDEDGGRHRFCIVGEEEACASTGLISWVSPLARSLIGRGVGDVVVWERPAGNVELEILHIAYPDLS
jgi:transcription elongation GreA/GreB family factor